MKKNVESGNDANNVSVNDGLVINDSILSVVSRRDMVLDSSNQHAVPARETNRSKVRRSNFGRCLISKLRIQHRVMND